MSRDKLLLLLLVFLAKSVSSFSQTKADSISMTFPKVLFINDKKEVLLSFDNDRKAFEVLSNGFITGPIDFKTYIDKLAKDIGIIYKTYRLGGLFTYIYPDKYRTFIRPYFVVRVSGYTNGQSVSDTTCKWFALKDALPEIKYPASAKITEKVLKNPKQVWTATFEEYGYTNPVDVSKIKFRIITDFYKIN